MSNARRPKPRKSLTTLRELVLDVDERLEGGDALSDVWLPHEEWTRLVEQAQEEAEVAESAPASDGAGVPAAPSAPAWLTRRIGLLEEAEKEMRQHRDELADRLEAQRLALADTLGASARSSFADLLERARGHSMALDAERELTADMTPAEGDRVQARIALAREVGWGTMNGYDDLLQVVRGYMLALDAERERAQSAEDAAHALAAEPELQADEAEEAVVVKPSPAELAADSLRRLNGAGWKRRAKKAREEDSLETCHHCGAGEDVGGELTGVHNDDVVPDGVFCAGCLERLRFHPDEWHRRHGPTMVESLDRAEAATAKRRKPNQQTLDEAISRSRQSSSKKKPRRAADPQAIFEDGVCTVCGHDFDQHMSTPGATTHGPFTCPSPPKKRAPGRATKKFPKGGSDPLEKCTTCGRELGEHDGTKCPAKAVA